MGVKENGELPGLEGRPAKALKPKKIESDGRVVALEAAFIERFHQRWGADVKLIRKPIPYERRQIKQAAAQLTDAELIALMDVLFTTKDFEVVRRNYTIGDFIYLLPRLQLMNRRNGSKSSRTQENLDAARRVIGKK